MKSALALINNIRKKDRPKRNGFLYKCKGMPRLLKKWRKS